MFRPTLHCECAQPASDRLMRKWCIDQNNNLHLLNGNSRTNEPTKFVMTFLSSSDNSLSENHFKNTKHYQ